MSEQGWQDFLAAEGVEDWVVLHGGATAVFRVRSLGGAAPDRAAVQEVQLAIAAKRDAIDLGRESTSRRACWRHSLRAAAS